MLQEAINIYQRNQYSSLTAANAYFHLGFIYSQPNHPQQLEAEAILRQAAEAHLKTCAYGTIVLARTYKQLGAILTKQRRFDEACATLLFLL